MSLGSVEKIAAAILYEGYMLYPYRPSSLKNQRRWTFGGLYPEFCAPRTGDRSGFQAQVLIASSGDPAVEARVRFLHLVEERKEDRSWEIGLEREVLVSNHPPVSRFHFPARQWTEAGALQRQERVDALIEISCEMLDRNVHKLTLRVTNVTNAPDPEDLSRDQASMFALLSAHAILSLATGEFVSLTDPRESLRAAAETCVNQGVWPVLAGDDGTHQCMLVSPIILGDYPQVAPESPGDLFDGAEIDEILTLRILAMTDAEKTEMRGLGERTRKLLERTEQLTDEQLMKLHGALRNPHAFDGGLRNKS